MSFWSFFVFLLSSFLANPVFSADEGFKSPEDYRPLNVYGPVDINSYPKPNSAKDCVQLCQSLIEGEINYWKETQKLMTDENPRLKLIVEILSVKKNLMNFHLYSRLLENREDDDMYSIYKSYETIIKSLNSFSDILSSAVFPESFSNKQEEFSFIENMNRRLLGKKRENLQNNMLCRGIMHSSVLGKSKFEVTQSEKGKFDPGVKVGSGQYDFCDVEYVSIVFFPLLKEIFNITQEILKDDDKKITQPKNRGKKKGRKKIQGPYSHSSQKPILTEPLLEEKKDSVQAVALPAPTLPTQMLHTQVKKDDALTSASGVQDSVGGNIPQTSMDEPLSQIVQDDREVYDLTPWKKYAKKDSVLRESVGKPILGEKSRYSPIFSLDDENALTIQIFLGTEKETAYESVRMAQYIKLIKALGGSVLNQKKCVHFMARSLVDHQWRSVAMHRLHQDDPHIIPRNTRYWKIAKQLLIDIGLSGES